MNFICGCKYKIHNIAIVCFWQYLSNDLQTVKKLCLPNKDWKLKIKLNTDQTKTQINLWINCQYGMVRHYMRHYVRHYVAMFRKWTKFGSNSWGIKFKNIGKQLRKLYNKKRVWNNMIYINNRPNLSLISVLLTSHFFFIYLNKSFIHSTYIIYHTTVDKNRNFF